MPKPFTEEQNEYLSENIKEAVKANASHLTMSPATKIAIDSIKESVSEIKEKAEMIPKIESKIDAVAIMMNTMNINFDKQEERVREAFEKEEKREEARFKKVNKRFANHNIKLARHDKIFINYKWKMLIGLFLIGLLASGVVFCIYKVTGVNIKDYIVALVI